MKLKRVKDFLNESVDDEIVEAKKILLELGFVENNGRYDFNGDVSISSYKHKKLFNRKELILPFGKIDGDFIFSYNNIKNLEYLPTHVKGELKLDSCNINSMKNFNTKFDKGLDIRNNHIHRLENMPNIINGQLNVSGNMLTTFEGCPEQVESFYAKDNWCNDLINAPKRIKYYESKGWSDKRSNIDLDKDKINKIEFEFYIEKTSYIKNDDKNKGITDYYSDLLMYIGNRFEIDTTAYFDTISTVEWPEDMNIDNVKKSVKGISKFNI